MFVPVVVATTLDQIVSSDWIHFLFNLLGHHVPLAVRLTIIYNYINSHIYLHLSQHHFTTKGETRSMSFAVIVHCVRAHDKKSGVHLWNDWNTRS